MTSSPPSLMQSPTFPYGSLTIVATGSLAAAYLPQWITWFAQQYVDCRVNVIATTSCQRFVSLEALRTLATGEAMSDSWEDVHHASIEETSDCYAIFPATIDYVMRLANGATASPSLMALQLTKKPIAIAPNFPGINPVIERNCEVLKIRSNVRFSKTVPAWRARTQEYAGNSGLYLPFVLEEIGEMAKSQENV